MIIYFKWRYLSCCITVCCAKRFIGLKCTKVRSYGQKVRSYGQKVRSYGQKVRYYGAVYLLFFYYFSSLNLIL